MKDNQQYKIPPFKKRMQALENYFKNHVNENELFLPEYEAAREINKIALKTQISEAELIEIVNIYNKANSKQHYNGAGWFDLRIHIQSLIHKLKLNHKLLPNNNIEINH